MAAVVDPQWDIEPYLRLRRLHGVKIEHVLETHNHADHVSGHGRLARATGATIHINELADAEYPHEAIADGWSLELGDVRIEAMQTDGHRPEHTSFLLYDTSRGDEPWAVLTGDSLFVGDVARPDLAVEPREGAAALFRSLHERLLVLADDVEVWPGHLGGSACGRAALDHKSSSTIGFEREHNDVLRIARRGGLRRAGRHDPGREAAERRAHRRDQPRPAARAARHPLPAHPARRRGRDRRGRPADRRAHQRAVRRGPHPRSDQRLGLRHRASRRKVAKVVPPDVELIVVAASDGYELEAAELLASVGLHVRGYLGGGMTSWRTEGRPVQRIELIDPAELAERLDGCDGRELTVLDVRDARRVRGGPHPRLGPHPLRASSPAATDELPRDARSPRSAAAASAAAWPPRSSSARASST